jgi:hypothetical protein
MQRDKYHYLLIIIAAVLIISGCTTIPQKPDQPIAGNP